VFTTTGTLHDRSHRAAVATRNAADFAACGVQVVDPWAE
jgi:hypothetical protein